MTRSDDTNTDPKGQDTTGYINNEEARSHVCNPVTDDTEIDNIPTPNALVGNDADVADDVSHYLKLTETVQDTIGQNNGAGTDDSDSDSDLKTTEPTQYTGNTTTPHLEMDVEDTEASEYARLADDDNQVSSYVNR